MRENVVQVSSFAFLNFQKFEIRKQIGKHATATIVGTISADNARRYVEIHLPGNGVELIGINQNGEDQLLLNGMIDNISVREQNGLHTLTLQLISWTYLMDIQKHIRTFQDRNMTYREVTQRMEADSNLGNILLPEHAQTAIGSMMAQYEETDWQFCARMASRLHTYIVADSLLDVPYLSIGMPNTCKSFEMAWDSYSVCRDNAAYQENVRHGVPGYSVADAISYEVVSREIYNLCDTTVFQGRSLYIYSVATNLIGAELVHTYTLREKSGVRCKEFFNQKLIGMSLVGNVKEIQMDKVRVNVSGDVPQKQHKWFPYATVYSSPDNTGWYFMPEIGDQIRLHFPSEHEEQSYVISSVHMGERDDPDIKSIRTKWGKAVVFSPDSILITNGAGSSILLEDEQGITVSTIKDVRITADQSIHVAAQGLVSVTGEEGVVVQQADNIISVNKTIDLSAGHVRIR